MPKISRVLLLVFILVLIGLIFLSLSTLSEAQTSFADKYFFIKRQLIWVFFGSFCLIIASKINLNLLKKISVAFYLISILTLLIVLLPGISTTILGARRWLSFGLFAVQPTEIFKFAAVIYFSQLFSQPEKRTIKNLLLSLTPPLLLIILEPNMSSVILITAIVFSLYYVSGGEILGLITLSSFLLLSAVVLILTSSYRSARLQTLINPSQDTSQSSYHANQIIIGLSSGGLFGKGIGNSSQKYQFLPQLATDSILAVIGEELGFVGVTLILFLYYQLIVSIIKISKNTPNPFLSLLTAAIAFWIAYQTLINVAAIAVLIPLTGIPLPFISYGGSSLSMLLLAIGLVLNVEHGKT